MGFAIGIGNCISFTRQKASILSPLVKAYIERVKADGGTVEAIRCLKDPGLDVYDWKYYFRVIDDGGVVESLECVTL